MRSTVFSLGFILLTTCTITAFASIFTSRSARADTCGASKDNTWTLKTEDTFLQLTVRDNRLQVDVLKNQKQGWNWVPAPTTVPLLDHVTVGKTPRSLKWAYRDATVGSDSNGTRVTITFVCAEPALELRSIWRTRPGAGPVENQKTVKNNTTETISFNDADLAAADLRLVSDAPTHFFPVASGTLGCGEGLPLPYQMIQVGSVHGIYLAYDYGCGRFASTAAGSQIASRWWAAGIRNTGTAAGETFRCPGILIETYQGDEDDGANAFRRWFWRYEITRSLYKTPTDPPIELCEWPSYDGRPDILTVRIKKHNYAGWGAGLWKTDLWHRMTGHAKSAELADACHSNGLQLCLYWDGPRTEAELLTEWNKSKYDYYRTDGGPFDQDDYHSFTDFNRKADNLYKKHGIKLENCSGGGNLRSLDLFRRMTFMTHSDASDLLLFFRHVYEWSYLMCPVQIKSDYPIASCYNGHTVGASMAERRGLLLGAVLLAPTRIASGDWASSVPTEFDSATIKGLKTVFALYNAKQRPILRGADVYHLLPESAVDRPGKWFGIQYHNTFIDKGSLLLWQNGGPTSQVIKLRGLDRGKTYRVTFEDAKDKGGAMTGAQLMDEGLAVPMGPNASEILWINCQDLPIASPAKSR